MTNADWIRGMTDEELARNVVSVCSYHECEDCPMNDGRGRCVSESSMDMSMYWLEREHEEK